MYNLLKIGNTCINKSFKEDIKMRRNNRPRNNEKSIMQNKILMYSIIGVGFLTIVLVGLLMYSRNLEEDMEENVLDFGDMTNVTSENTTNSTNTNTQSVSTEIGKSVNEALNNSTTTNVENNSNNRKQTTDDCCHPFGDTFPAAQPNVVIPSQCLDSRPEAVRQVEPQCGEPNQIQYCIYNIAFEIVVDEKCAICRRRNTSVITKTS